MARRMKFNRIGPEQLETGETGIWKVETGGAPNGEVWYDTYYSFIISAKTFDEVVKLVKQKAKRNDHDGYVWGIELVGVDILSVRKNPFLSASYKSG